MTHELAAAVAAAGLAFDCGCGGTINATIAVVAEAPGERETQQKVPLIGSSGKVLWDVLRKDGITRNDVYITNVVKRKLVHAAESLDVAPKAAKLALSKQELEHWKHVLLEELSRLPKLKYVLALGNYALRALTGESGIMQFRGSVYSVKVGNRTVQVLCTYNPAFIMREPKQEVVFRMDCNKLQRLVKGTFKPPAIRSIINPSFEHVMDYIDYCQGSNSVIAYDIETMNNETACIGLAVHDYEGMCINFRTQAENTFSPSEERTIRQRLQTLFADPAMRFVTQNGHFDATWLWFKDRLRVHGHYLDTMLAHHLLYPSLPHNLGFISAQYTDQAYYKDDGKQWRDTGDIDTFWRYNVMDCCITRIASTALMQELREQKLDGFFFNHVMKLQPHLVRMTVGGVLCDEPLKQQVSEDLAAQVVAALARCQVLARVATGDDAYVFNPRSVPQTSKLLFTDLRLVGRGTKVDKENRDRIRKHPRTPAAARDLLTAIDHYITEAKFASTYANSGIDDDGRFRCEFRQTGVQSAPGRLSSAQTMWGTGLNLQNIPERAKPMFKCDAGYELSYFDMSQIEARFVAVLAGIDTWLQQFETARLQPGAYDAHCALASEMFKVPYDKVPHYDRTPDGEVTIRFVAKRCRHGLNYRMAPDRLATTAGLDIREAEKAWRLYHAASPEIMQWWDDIAKLVRRDRCITTALGRRWLLLERYDERALESVVAFEPQSMNGDHTASVIYKCERDAAWPRDARMLLNIHDALVAINRPSDGPLVRSIMRKYAEEPLLINSVRNRLEGVDRPVQMIVPAEFGVSLPDEFGVHRWSTIKKLPYGEDRHPYDAVAA